VAVCLAVCHHKVVDFEDCLESADVLVSLNSFDTAVVKFDLCVGWMSLSNRLDSSNHYLTVSIVNGSCPKTVAYSIHSMFCRLISNLY
jgi:hypothetical protein